MVDAKKHDNEYLLILKLLVNLHNYELRDAYN